MNTVRYFRDPHNPWWRYAVEHPDPERPERVLLRPFATKQGAEDYIERKFPGEVMDWDTRSPEEREAEYQAEEDRYEDAKRDAEMDRMLAQEAAK